ncbi:MAG TPA: hypothetical protein VHO07_26240 [Streptosporangiaceae bacterium]|nr:hypothetical protein [Streptosporangiaceae bacterium]
MQYLGVLQRADLGNATPFHVHELVENILIRRSVRECGVHGDGSRDGGVPRTPGDDNVEDVESSARHQPKVPLPPLRQLISDGTSVTQAARTLKISRSTAYAALREHPLATLTASS